MSTYVVSDLHGQYGVFMKGIEEIGLEPDDFLYVIGDAIDRGNDGIRILQEIINRPNMDLILGNHELLMLNSVNPEGKPLCDGGDADLWLDWNGGYTTFAQYRQELSDDERKYLLRWLRKRLLIKPLRIQGWDYVLCHTYYIKEHELKPLSDIPPLDADDIVWCSMFRNDPETRCENIYAEYPGKLFITGHVPVQRIVPEYQKKNVLPHLYRQGNLINIDGGLAYGHTGLADAAIFLRLDDMTEFVVELSHEGFEDQAEI
ncbi:MAG: fructose-bisphosphatase class III [Lachnospiraceae bacterium]|nr:fructose-bisphosphatase class III [Lachnospiraceae bacterium]